MAVDTNPGHLVYRAQVQDGGGAGFGNGECRPVGSSYRDGGMGDRLRVQGNTPAQPLAEAGCTHVVVVMLGQGVLWDRNEWPNMIPVEIRPSFDINDGDWLKAIVNFEPTRIAELIERGEADSMRCLEGVLKAEGLVGDMRTAMNGLQKAMQVDANFETKYDQVMKEIRNDCGV